MESIAADVAAAQCDSAQIDKENVKHFQGPATASQSSLGSAASRKSSLTSGYGSDTPDSLDKQSAHHSQSSVEDEGGATRQHTFGTYRNKSFSTSFCPPEALPCSTQKKRQSSSRSKLLSPSQLESPPQTPNTRRRKIAVYQMLHTMPPPPPMINNSLISGGSVHSFTHRHDPRLQVTDLVSSASEDEGGEDGVESEQYSWRLCFGYPFVDEAASESDYDTDSIYSSRSNSHSSILY